jgi:hypothetical protein
VSSAGSHRRALVVAIALLVIGTTACSSAASSTPSAKSSGATAVSRTSSTTLAPKPPRRAIAVRELRGHDGMLLAFGDASFRGSTEQLKSQTAPIVGMASSANGRGYWLAAADGGVFAFGAPFYGSIRRQHLAQPVVGITATPGGRGYWLVARDGGVFGFGNARYYGSLGRAHLRAPIRALAAAPAGAGYWLLGQDGGVFAFGHAHYYGSVPAKRLRAPAVGLAATPSGRGYWIATADGTVVAFGDAHSFSPAATKRDFAPTVGIASNGTPRGYWLIGDDGGVFAYGNARFYGSAVGLVPAVARAVQIAGTPDGNGYRLLLARRQIVGGVTAMGDSVMVDAAPALQALIPGISVDAAVDRSPPAGIALLQGLAASGQLPGSIVWHLGTNGTLTAEEIQQVLQIAAGRRVVMLTDHCGYCPWAVPNNTTLAANCTGAQNCIVADWNALATKNPGWFGTDGVHMGIGGAGAQAYARLVASDL